MILFFGPAGAGKSVQGQFLGVRRGWKWISSGHILRESGDPAILAELEKGNLISSEIMFQLFEDVLHDVSGEQVILDGFPRKIEQVEWLYDNQSTYNYTIDLAIVIDVSREEVTRRMLVRGRSDDTLEAVEERVRIYHEQIDPILNYLEQKDVPIARVNGIGRIGDIHETINEEVNLVVR